MSAHLLKPSAKRRRTKQQIQADKLRAAKQQVEIENKIAAYDAMQAKVEVAEANVEEAKKVHAQLQALLNSGALVRDEEGNLVPFNIQDHQQVN